MSKPMVDAQWFRRMSRSRAYGRQRRDSMGEMIRRKHTEAVQRRMEEVMPEAMRLQSLGLNYTEIAQQLDMDKSTLRRYFRRWLGRG